MNAAKSLGMHTVHVRGDISEAIAELNAALEQTITLPPDHSTI